MSTNGEGKLTKVFSLKASQWDGTEQYLTQLHRRLGAQSTLLVDVTGQLIASVGNTSEIDPVTIGALAASNMAATAEMARLAGEASPYSHLYHEGEKRSIYLAPVGDRFLLVIVFDLSVQVGLVRLLAKIAGEELIDIVNSLQPSNGMDSGVELLDKGDPGLGSITEELDRAFKAWD